MTTVSDEDGHDAHHHHQDTYNWTVVVGSVAPPRRQLLTVEEAALKLTNMQAGTAFTMRDLRTARQMVDLWDDEDVFEWTVGNVE